MEKSLAEIAFNAYGDKAGAHGPWKTFDGRPMPKWEELSGDAGVLTQARWEAAVSAAITAHENRNGVSTGRAIGHSGVGA